MARISTKLDEKVFKISKFLGVNESPDGDTGLKLGEASAMQNFKITDEGALQKRAGTRNVAGLLNGYSVVVGSTSQIILTELNRSTASFHVHDNINVSDTGLLSVSGGTSTLNYANANIYKGYYYKDNEGIVWKFDTCVYTQATTGTIVNGGSVNIAETSEFIVETYSSIRAYSGVRVVNGSVEYDGDSAYILSRNQIYKYYKFRSVMYEITSVSYVRYVNPDGSYAYDGYRWYGKKVTVAEEDKYEWKFYPVSAHEGVLNTPVRGIWSGIVDGTEYLVATCNGILWALSIDEHGVWSKEQIGLVDTDNPTHMFGFDNKLYIINGKEYKVWDGDTLENVAGYRPLVSVARSPDGAQQQLLEQVNLLNGQRRAWFSPNGTDKDFILPEKPVASVDYVKNLVTGDNINPSDYTVDTTDGKVTFANSPTAGTNTIEIGYTVSNSARNEVTAMRYSEIYNGATDNRVFLYGDGSNKAIYSGLDYDGKARADYFPAMNVIHVGDTATPITGMIRHYNKLMAFKTDSAYTIDYDTITLVDGSVTAGFFVKPVNRGLGNTAPGQVCLVENNPRTLDAGGIYEWQTNAFTYDQRNAVRVSDKVAQTLKRMDLERAVAFYDKITHEYFVAQNGLVVVQNLQNGAWYVYANLPITCMINYKDEFYFGTPDGYIRRMSRDYFSDNGEPIECYWESGSTDFNAPHRLKYSRGVWVTIKPEAKGEIKVTAITDKVNQLVESTAKAEWSTSASGFFSFLDLDFETLSFNTSRMPTMEAHKIKAKKFVYYKLIFASDSNNTTATVTDVAMHVRYLSHVR